jgi:hypothetical protein
MVDKFKHTIRFNKVKNFSQMVVWLWLEWLNL